MKTPLLAAALCAAALFTPPAGAGVTEDDWLKVVTPDKVKSGSAFEIKVTLKKDLGPDENVSVAVHTFKPDGGWRDTGQWRPPQTIRKGETATYVFAAEFVDFRLRY